MKIIKILKRRMGLARTSKMNSDWSLNIGYYRNRGLVDFLPGKMRIRDALATYEIMYSSSSGYKYVFDNDGNDPGPGRLTFQTKEEQPS